MAKFHRLPVENRRKLAKLPQISFSPPTDATGRSIGQIALIHDYNTMASFSTELL